MSGSNQEIGSGSNQEIWSGSNQEIGSGSNQEIWSGSNQAIGSGSNQEIWREKTTLTHVLISLWFITLFFTSPSFRLWGIFLQLPFCSV